jgi:hypothetical protein
MTTLPSVSESLEDETRQRAYFLWLDQGCPHGADWEHWFTAKQQLIVGIASAVAEKPAPAAASSPHYSIGRTLADHQSDPTHRFHAPGAPHDSRLDVVAGEARQRVRGRHFDSSLRAQPKERQ